MFTQNNRQGDVALPVPHTDFTLSGQYLYVPLAKGDYRGCPLQHVNLNVLSTELSRGPIRVEPEIDPMSLYGSASVSSDRKAVAFNIQPCAKRDSPRIDSYDSVAGFQTHTGPAVR